MERFQQLPVRQKAIFNRYSIKSYKKLVVYAETVALGPAGAAVEVRRYYRNMRINKEIFCALVHFRATNIMNDYQDLAHGLKEELILLGRQPSPENLQNVIENAQILCKNLLEEQTGTESKMTIRYLRDISSLLALVSAVREKNLERHLQAEREMLKYCFAFDHINYARRA